jgi:hypothetical protein
MGGVEVNRNAYQVLRWAAKEKAELNRRLKDVLEVESAARMEIERTLGDNEIGEVDGKQVVAWTHVKVNRLNQTELKRLRPDVHAEFCELVDERRFRLIKEKDDGARNT